MLSGFVGGEDGEEVVLVGAIDVGEAGFAEPGELVFEGGEAVVGHAVDGGGDVVVGGAEVGVAWWLRGAWGNRRWELGLGTRDWGLGTGD